MSIRKNGKKAVLGLSGGVDSTAAALLLKEKGFEVIGLYFDVFGNNLEGRKKAEKVARELGIDIIVKNVSKEFKNIVIKNFIDEYMHGRTPNPCVLCNPTVKFHTLITEADRIGADFIATGHYARAGYSDVQNCYVIKTAANIKKDQSYMLYRLPSSVIKRLILPLSDIYDKEQTRELTRGKDMSNSEDKDSQEICFIKEGEDYISYLERNGAISKEGNFIDKEGKILGRHKGISNYTIGQRKGLGIALGKPAFVTNIDAENNTVTLGDNEELFKREVICKNPFFTGTSKGKIPEALKNKKLLGKIRYAAKASPCTVKEMTDERIKVEFEEPQRAATGGQSLVLYYKDEIAGGGIIEL